MPENSEAITGSGSLLPSSESDTWNRHQSSQWPSVNNNSISPGLGSVRNTHDSTSPTRHRTANPQHSRSESPYFSPNQPSAIGQGMSNKPSNQGYLDATSGSLKSPGAFDAYQQVKVGRQNSDSSTRRQLDAIVFGNNEMGYTAQRSASGASAVYSGYNSSAASRSGSLPPSRHGIEQPSQFGVEHSVNSQQIPYGNSDSYSHRPNQLSRTSTYSTNGTSKYADHASSTQYNDLAVQMNKMDLGKENQESAYHSYYDYPQSTIPSNPSGNYGVNVNGYRSNSFSLEVDNRQGPSVAPPYNQHRIQFGDRTSHSPTSNEFRRNHDSPTYPTNSTPPLLDHQRSASIASVRSNVGTGQAALLERRLRGLQQEQQAYPMAQSNPVQFRAPFTHPYDYNPQNMLRMNPLAQYYPLQVMNGYQNNRTVSRVPAIDSTAGESLRSSLLEEFRTHSKGTKRYELKVSLIRSPSREIQLTNNRISMIMLWSLVETSTVLDSFSKSWRTPIATRRNKFSGRFCPTPCS